MQTVSIRSAQNVQIDYDAASILERGLAQLIDLVVIISLFLGLIGLFDLLDVDVLRYSRFWQGLMLLLFMAYFFLFELINRGRTLGKMALGTRVVRLNGTPLGATEAMVRSVLLLAEGPFTGYMLGLLMIVIYRKGQRMGDIISNTAVIHGRSSKNQFSLDRINKLAPLAIEDSLYPQVTQLTDRDMLLIKDFLARLQDNPNRIYKNMGVELVEHLCKILDISLPKPADYHAFLKKLLEEYILLTR